MSSLNQGVIRRINISLPPLPVQRKIAAILSAYDDLIENNTRRIALLEKMAEEVYREWFVRLRFPGHERVPVHQGVPEGWELKPVGELLEYYIGGGWGKKSRLPYIIGRHTLFAARTFRRFASMRLTLARCVITRFQISNRVN